MPKAGSPRSGALRQTLAQEAARAMAEEGIRDFRLAKRKASERLGVDPSGQSMPTNREVEDALATHQRLFGGAAHEESLQRCRLAAVEAMRMFDDYEPRLVGPVLRGTVGPGGVVNLHLFSDTPEQVAVFLMGAGIPYEEATRRVRMPDGRTGEYPVFRFVAGEVGIEATVFPAVGIRQAPVSPVDGRPMPRANLREVESLLAG
jgi:hypothetical protein